MHIWIRPQRKNFSFSVKLLFNYFHLTLNALNLNVYAELDRDMGVILNSSFLTAIFLSILVLDGSKATCSKCHDHHHHHKKHHKIHRCEELAQTKATEFSVSEQSASTSVPLISPPSTTNCAGAEVTTKGFIVGGFQIPPDHDKQRIQVSKLLLITLNKYYWRAFYAFLKFRLID